MNDAERFWILDFGFWIYAVVRLRHHEPGGVPQLVGEVAGLLDALDAGRLSPDRRRPRASEDAVELRRVGLGMLLAAAEWRVRATSKP